MNDIELRMDEPKGKISKVHFTFTAVYFPCMVCSEEDSVRRSNSTETKKERWNEKNEKPSFFMWQQCSTSYGGMELDAYPECFQCVYIYNIVYNIYVCTVYT